MGMLAWPEQCSLSGRAAESMGCLKIKSDRLKGEEKETFENSKWNT